MRYGRVPFPSTSSPGREDDSAARAELERFVVSLDLSKAYDTTLWHGRLSTLRSWRIRGRMFNMLWSFLSERTFQVAVGRHLSREHELENNVPQGFVPSMTLFLVAM